MKKIIIPLLVFSLFFIACDNKPKNDTITITDEEGKGQVTIDPEKVQDAAQDLLKQKEELAKLTPLSADELKKLVPQELMGATASDIDVNSAMGTSVASADYKINDSTDLKLEIVDCAGPGGAGLFGMQYLNMINVNSDDEDEYVKTIDFNGGKAMENCKKNRNKCSLVYFTSNRFLISLEGDNMGIEALKDVAKGLKIK